MGLEWTGPELTSGFLRLLNTGLSRAKVCFFVDGLDELDGDHNSMIRFFRDLGTGNQVKMCLSSRPWQVFERAFARSVPNLRLQELILGDMTNYAYDSLYVETFPYVIPRWFLWNGLLNSLLLTFVLSHHCLADGGISMSAELSGRTLTTPRISCGRLSHPPMACSYGLDWWSGRLSRSSAALKHQLRISETTSPLFPPNSQTFLESSCSRTSRRSSWRRRRNYSSWCTLKRRWPSLSRTTRRRLYPSGNWHLPRGMKITRLP